MAEKPTRDSVTRDAMQVSARYAKFINNQIAEAEQVIQIAKNALKAEQSPALQAQVTAAEEAVKLMKKAREDFEISHQKRSMYELFKDNLKTAFKSQKREWVEEFNKTLLPEARLESQTAISDIDKGQKALQTSCDALRKTLGIQSEADILRAPASGNPQEILSARGVMLELRTGNQISPPMSPVSTTSARSLTQAAVQQAEQINSRKANP